MTSDPQRQTELQDLIEKVCDGTFEQDDMNRLSELLADDPAAQQLYLQQVDLTNALRWEAARQVPRLYRAPASPSRWFWPAAAISMAVLACVFAILYFASNGPPRVVEKTVYVEKPRTLEGDQSSSSNSQQSHGHTSSRGPARLRPILPNEPLFPPEANLKYLKDRNLAIAQGVDFVPPLRDSAGGIADPPPSRLEVQRELVKQILSGEEL